MWWHVLTGFLAGILCTLAAVWLFIHNWRG